MHYSSSERNFCGGIEIWRLYVVGKAQLFLFNRDSNLELVWVRNADEV